MLDLQGARDSSSRICYWPQVIKSMELNKYKIAASRGFLPSRDPVVSLPKAFDPWEHIAVSLPELLREERLRQEVSQLSQEFPVSELKSEGEWWRAFCLLAFVSHSYVWCEGKEGVTNSLPKALAVPWCKVARHLDIPPVITHASITLYNWRKIDPNAEMSRSNITTLFSFTGSRDEECFCVNIILAEKAAADIVNEVPSIIQNCNSQNNGSLIKNLHQITDSIKTMTESFYYIRKECRPAVFFNQVFGYLAGWEDSNMLGGMVYEGVSQIPIQHAGGNPSQSSAVATLDVVLGVNHSGKVREYFKSKEQHMIKEHRAFLQDLRSKIWLHDYIKSCGDHQLLSAYNSCISALVLWRSEHIKIVCLYVIIQKNKMKAILCCPANEKGETDKFMTTLKAARDNTRLARL